ncbi:MAG: hypothetical protein ACI9OB_000163 [Nonlabens sp.]
MLRSGLALTIVVATMAPIQPAHAGDPDLGSGSGSDVVDTSSDLSTAGDAYASIEVSEAGSVTPGAEGSWAWPVDTTVYGKPVLHIPEVAGGVTPFDEYCFRISYSTSHIDMVEERQDSANGGFEVAQDRDYLEPAEAEYNSHLKSYNDRVALRNATVSANETVRSQNEELEEGEERKAEQPVPPSLSKPVEPAFPLPLCPGTPGTVPDFVPAFKAAAAALKSVEAPVLYIPPGHGITGLEAYLTTGRQMTFTHDVKTFSQLGWDLTDDALAPTAISGTVEFEGSGTYVVDWADGAASEPQTAPGATYAEAQAGEASVTHSYIDTGTYPITITDTWRVKMVVSFLGETYTFIHEETLDPWGYPGGFQVTELRSRRDS